VSGAFEASIRVASSGDELDEYARVWTEVNEDAPISGDEVRRRFAERRDGRAYFLADVDGRPVGTGFAGLTSTKGRAAVLVAVLQGWRGRGVGSSLLDASLAHARSLGATSALGTVSETWLHWAERRGFRELERVVELVREVMGNERSPGPPAGITIVELDEEHADGAFAVYAEGVADIPSVEPLTTRFDSWWAEAAASPLALVALDGDTVVGYAELERRTDEVLGHELTAVARTHRRRGIAGALKRTQIAWAAEHGYRRLLTDTHLANDATRRLNEQLGYRPLPPVIDVVRKL
jgi:GNAT superfamily N-acetyltransferase